MKKTVKKSLSIILSVVLLLTSLPVLSISSFAEIFDIKDDLTEFSEDVTKLIREAETTSYSINFYGSANAEKKTETANPEYETARIIVKAKGKIDKLNAVSVVDGYNDLHILQFATSLDAQTACEYYLELDNVEYAQPDRIVTATELETVEEDKTFDEILAEKPKLEEPAILVGIKALKEYFATENITYNQKIDVAVIDTGVESTHELLKGRVEPTGKNFSNDGDVDSSEDNEGHGTHVAGILIVNSLQNVTIKPYKVLDSEGRGTELQAVLGIESAIADGVDVINMSMGARMYSEAMHDAVKNAIAENIPVVVAAGNDFTNIDKVSYSPASFPECITVMAHGTDCRGNPGSNYGELCDVAAPGMWIYSSYLNNTYETLSGTSMATPIVSAAVTYALLDNPRITPDEISALLKKYAVPEPNVSYSNRKCLYVEFLTRDIMELSAPVFSVEGGEFSETFELTLSGVEDGVTIYYNKSEFMPDYYIEYTEPITVKYNTTIKAYAYRKGTITSQTVENSYTRIFPNEDSKYIMSEDGTIVEYLGNDTELVVPEVIQGIEVKAVGRQAFYENQTLESVILPDAVTKIGAQSFAASPNLKYVRALGVVSVDSSFSGCSALESFESDSLTTIGGYAFNGCSSLKYFDFSKVTTIESCAFMDATGVPSLVSDALTTISGQAFKDSDIKVLDIPNATKIEGWAFSGCSSLEKVNIPLVTQMGELVFSGCSSLPEIKADNLTSVGRYAFSGCILLEEVSFPNLTYLGGSETSTYTIGAFNNCTNLKYVNLPKVTVVPQQTFWGCTSLEEISMPQVTYVGTGAFMDCTSLKSVDLPQVTKFSQQLFDGCVNLKIVEMPSVKEVVRLAFYGDCYIERLILPNVEKIRDLPKDALVAIGSTANYLPLNYSDLTCGRDVTIYGSFGTYAYDWTKDQFMTYKKINQKNALLKDVPLDITQAEDTTLEVDVIGFRLTYQWYSNIVEDNLTGTPIEGATGPTLDTTQYPAAPYYYCVVTSTDVGYDPVEIRTGCAVVPNILDYMTTQIRFGVAEDGSYSGFFDIRTRAIISDEDFKKYVGETNQEAIERIDKIGFVYSPFWTEFDEDLAEEVAKGAQIDGYIDVPVNHIYDADGYYMFSCVVSGIEEAEYSDADLTVYAYICVDGVWYFYPEKYVTPEFHLLVYDFYDYEGVKHGWPERFYNYEEEV